MSVVVSICVVVTLFHRLFRISCFLISSLTPLCAIVSLTLLILNFQLNPFQSDLWHFHFNLPITFHCDVVVLVVGLFVTVLVDVVPRVHCNKTYEKMWLKSTYYLCDGDIKKFVICYGRVLINMSTWLAAKYSLQTC